MSRGVRPLLGALGSQVSPWEPVLLKTGRGHTTLDQDSK